MLPIYANTLELLKETFPHLMTVIHVAPNEHVENFIAGAVHRWPVPVVLIPGGTTHLRYDAFSVSPIAPHSHKTSIYIANFYELAMSIHIAVVENLFNTF